MFVLCFLVSSVVFVGVFSFCIVYVYEFSFFVLLCVFESLFLHIVFYMCFFVIDHSITPRVLWLVV